MTLLKDKNVIYLGKLLKENDINIFFSADNQSGDGTVSIDPYCVLYTIYDCTTGKAEIIRQTINSKAMRFDTGHYFVPLKLHPRIFRVGRHKIEWMYKRFLESSLRREMMQFDITRTAHFSGEFCRSVYVNDSSVCTPNI